MNKWRHFLKNLSLSQRFMFASLVILLAGMVGIGAWVQKQIVTGVIHRTGATTALYVGSFVAPQLQELGDSGEISPAYREALGRLLTNTPMGKQIVVIKIWDTRGKLIYSTNSSAIGKTFPMHGGMLRARLGEVVSSVSQLDEEENIDLGVVYGQLLETYSPIWLSGTDKVIAVAEFYQLTDDLEAELAVSSRRSWLVVGLATLAIYLLLAGFVRDASHTIQHQQTELAQKVIQLTDLLDQNRELSDRVRRASASVTQLNEGYLKRIGSELHDGPAQDLSLSILKLDALAERLEKTATDTDMVTQFNEVGISLQSALKEMRSIATGLSLPQLSELGLTETVQRVVSAHERRTGTHVELILQPIPNSVALSLRITIYRLIQEALNNAYRHAGGIGQRVLVSTKDSQLVIMISDNGAGFDPRQTVSDNHLGLSGMRERVESLGGWFQIESHPGQGTTIIARLPFQLDGGMKI
ncbi:MAG: sensor histidine kinase [Chloroflexi bacterium]|nr:sensor histidine kinase [Chloroflexota bacterium]